VDTSDIDVPEVIDRLVEIVRVRAGEALSATERAPRGHSGGASAS